MRESQRRRPKRTSRQSDEWPKRNDIVYIIQLQESGILLSQGLCNLLRCLSWQSLNEHSDEGRTKREREEQ